MNNWFVYSIGFAVLGLQLAADVMTVACWFKDRREAKKRKRQNAQLNRLYKFEQRQ